MKKIIKDNPNIITVLLIVITLVITSICGFSIVGDTEAYFTDRRGDSVGGNSGIVDISVDSSGIDLFDDSSTASDNVYEWDMCRDFYFTVKNQGSITVDIAPVLKATTELPDGVTYDDLFWTFDIYSRDDVELIDGVYVLKAGAVPDADKRVTEDGITCTFANTVLSGNSDSEEQQIRWIDVAGQAISNSTYMTLSDEVKAAYTICSDEFVYDYVIYFNSAESLQVGFEFDLTVNANKQGNANGWKEEHGVVKYIHLGRSPNYNILEKGSEFNAHLQTLGAMTAGNGAVVFTNTGVPETAVASAIDVSADKDKSVMAYTADSGDIMITTVDGSTMYANESCYEMFKSTARAIKFENFDTSKTTSMGSMFYGYAYPSLDISSFNTSNVTNMSGMFYGSSAITSLNISGIDTSNVTTMRTLFYNCSGLTSLDVSNFNTGKVTNMGWTFYGCSGLTSLDVSSFDTSNVTSSDGMKSMFNGCVKLTTLDLSGFETTNVKDMSYMFNGCSSLTSLDISKFNTSNVGNMYCMFYNCKELTRLDVSGFNTSKVTNMAWMFASCSKLKNLDLSNWNSSEVLTMTNMFRGCSSLTSLDVSGFNTSKVTDMSYMFQYCNSLESIDVSSFNTSNVTNMAQMFRGPNFITELDLSHFNTSKVTDMNNMFQYCNSLTSLDVSGWDVRAVKNMYNMFQECTKIKSFDLSTWQVRDLENCEGMFSWCREVEVIDLTGWDVSNITNTKFMFSCCFVVDTIYASDWTSQKNVSNSENMFGSCYEIKGAVTYGSAFDWSMANPTTGYFKTK